MLGMRSQIAHKARTRIPRLDRPVPPMGYIPGLDGIRAVAVIGVLLYHGNSSWLPGGFLGVDVFFVLSGFLISTILFQSLQDTGKINFRRFYIHRARRLLPALLVTLVLTGVLVALFARDAASQFVNDLVPSLFYVANWSFIFDQQSYFESIGRPPVLQHLWSLAVEEQFYLLWPLLLLGIYRFKGRRGVGQVALAIALASTLAMAVLAFLWNAPAEGDASRLYFGTDTHAMGLLLGASLAAVWRPGALPRVLSPMRSAALTAVGVGGLGIIIASYLWMTHEGSFLYRGGFFLVSAGAAILIAVTTHPAGYLGSVLATQPLRYLGQRSYGIYLYHWPIFLVTRPEIDLPFGGLAAFAVSMACTLIVAELSYRYIEMPIRTGQLKKLWYSWEDRGIAVKRSVAWGSGSAAFLVALYLFLASLPAPSAQDYLGGRTELGAGDLTSEQQPLPITESESDGTLPVPGEVQSAPEPAQGATATTVTLEEPITIVGDSVILGAAGALAQAMPNAVVDAAISRQPGDIFDRVESRLQSHRLADVVVIHPGTNGRVTRDALRATLSDLSDRQRVVIVTAYGPGSWQKPGNEAIYEVVPEFSNARVADWASVASGRGELFVADGVHPSPAGLEVLEQTITSAIQAP